MEGDTEEEQLQGTKPWTPAHAGVKGAAQGRGRPGSWGTAGKRKDTVQHSKSFLIVASMIGWTLRNLFQMNF